MIDSDIIEDNTENNFKESDKSRLRMILLLFVLFIGFWGLSFISDKWLDNRIIKRIAIYGNNMAQKEDILPLISDSIINKQIKNINSSEIIKIVKTNDFVFDVNVNALFNGEFQIFISERKPIAITIDNDGIIKYTDNSGFVFPYYHNDEYIDLPLVRGNENTNEFEATVKLLNKIINEGTEYSDIISEIFPGRGKNTYEIISSDYAYHLVLDDKSSLSEQLSKYYTFMGSSLCGNDLAKIDYIDLRWEKRIVIGKSI